MNCACGMLATKSTGGELTCAWCLAEIRRLRMVATAARAYLAARTEVESDQLRGDLYRAVDALEAETKANAQARSHL